MKTLVNKFKGIGIDLYPAGKWEYVDGVKSAIDNKRADGMSWDMFPDDNMAKYRAEVGGFYIIDYDDLSVGTEILPPEIVEKSLKTFRYYTSNKNKMHCIFKRTGDFPYNRYIWAEGAVDSLPRGIIFTGHPSGSFELVEDEVLSISDDEIAAINMAIADAKGDSLDEHGNYHWAVEYGSASKVITHKGHEIGTLMSLPFEGTRCDCPFGETHSDGAGGIGYGFVTDGGGVGCNSCEKILLPPPFEKALSVVHEEIVEIEGGGQTTREVDPPKVWRELTREKYAIYHRGKVNYLGKAFFTDQFKYVTKMTEGVPFAQFEDRATVFNPKEHRKFYEDGEGNKFFNEFDPTTAMIKYDYARENNVVESELPLYIGRVLDNVFESIKVRDLWLHKLAYHLKYFDAGRTVNIVIGKLGGEGKGLIFNDLLSMIYESYSMTITKSQLLEKHNGYMNRMLCLTLEEIHPDNKKQGENILEKLKVITSNDKLSVRAMREDATEIVNNVIMNVTTNKDMATSIDSRKDRRIIVSSSTGGNLMEKDWWSGSIIDKFRSELDHFLKYLAGIELCESKYSQVIETVEKVEMFYESMTLRQKVAHNIKYESWDELYDLCSDEFIMEKIQNTYEGSKIIFLDDIRDAFKFEGGHHALSKALKSLELPVERKKRAGRLTQVIEF